MSTVRRQSDWRSIPRYRRHDNVSAATIGDGHAQCRVMVTRYASHLVVEALSGYKNGTVRQRGKLKRIY